MSEKKKQFILSVVPLVKIPLSREQFFYYLADEKLPEGSLVNIPLFNKKTEGIVIKSKNDFSRVGGMILKKIEKVLEKNFLTKNQLELAKYISDYYVVSLGIAMKSFVAKRVRNMKKEVRSKKCEETQNADTKKIILTKEQKKAVNEITNNNFKFQISSAVADKFLLFGPAGSGKTEVYIHSILELKKQNPENQFLILVPEKTLTPQALERYGAYFPEKEIALLSSSLSKGDFFANWQKIKSSETKIIIGTRMAVFAPFQKLALIVIDEEQDMSFKQWDMNPRYDARTVAEKLAELHKSKIVFGSATPRLESFYKAQNGQYELLKLNKAYSKIENLKLKIENFELVDMKKERWTKNYSCVSKKLKSEIAYALKNKLQTILFINRQGMSAFSVCKNCKTVLKCPRCDHALVYANSGEYKCIHCAFTSSAIPNCSKCKGIEFKNVGLGTQKVEREISNLFPGTRILRIDAEKVREKDFQKFAYEQFSQGKFDILIGTQMITKGWDLPKLSLVGVIDADNSFAIPDFRAGEKAWQDLVQLSGRVSRPGAKFPGMVIIQTYHPENKLLKSVVEKKYLSFYEQEIKDRKLLNYPPFGKIAKLLFQGYNQDKVIAETKKVYDFLISAESELKISEPSDCFAPKARGKYRRQIILKFEKQLPEKILTILGSLPSGWIIDIDPISIA